MQHHFASSVFYDDFLEKAGAQMLNGKCFTVPSLASGKLYLRSESEMICLDLSEANFRQRQLTH